MIPYMVGKLAPNPSQLTRWLVKYVPGRDYFRAVSSQNGDKYVTSPPPHSLNLSSLGERHGYRRCSMVNYINMIIPSTMRNRSATIFNRVFVNLRRKKNVASMEGEQVPDGNMG